MKEKSEMCMTDTVRVSRTSLEPERCKLYSTA